MPLKYGEHWVTLSNGSRVLLDKDGQVVAGFRDFIGKNISECGPSVLELHKYNGEKKTFADCLKNAKGKSNVRYLHAAKDYFESNLKNTFVETALRSGKSVDIHFTGKTWNKLRMNMVQDPLKAELVRFMPVILQKRFNFSSQKKNKNREDFDNFHYFRAYVRTKDQNGKAVRVRVKIDVGERANSKDDFEAYHMSYDGNKKSSFALDASCRGIAHDAHTQDGVVSKNMETHSTFAKLAEDNINSFCEVVNMEVEAVEPIAQDEDQAILDHFCQRTAELGMDVFSLRKGV